ITLCALRAALSWASQASRSSEDSATGRYSGGNLSRRTSGTWLIRYRRRIKTENGFRDASAAHVPCPGLRSCTVVQFRGFRKRVVAVILIRTGLRIRKRVLAAVQP